MIAPLTRSLSDAFFARAPTAESSPGHRLARALGAIRTHLGMDVAFVSEFEGGRRYFRHVDSSHPRSPVKVGGSDPLEDSYCQRVVDGRLPELMCDAALVDAAREIAATLTLPVGAHLSVPIRLRGGDVYGTFCCFSFTPDHSLNERDLGMMRVFADLAAEQIEDDVAAQRTRADITRRIDAVLADDALSMVYQPIYQTREGRVVGFESLARFAAKPPRTPDVWFREAAQIGRGASLEVEAVRRGLRGLEHLPADIYVSFNASPETILGGELAAALDPWPLDRVVMEVTEHAVINHYSDLAAVVGPWRARGLRVAVDDAGAGYASFRHILSLAPDLIKLDMSITRDIDTDLSRRALGGALVSFAQATGCRIIAEGVETAAELATLRQLGIEKAQGYFLGRPSPLADAVRLTRRA